MYLGRDEALEDYDPYDYFEDVAYLSDSYNDGKLIMRRALTTEKTEATSNKRKRNGAPTEAGKPTPKRRRTRKGATKAEGRPETASTVVWKASAERDEEYGATLSVKAAHLRSFALLPGWKSLDGEYETNDISSLGALPSPPVSEDEDVKQKVELESGEEQSEHVGGRVDVADLSSIAGLLTSNGMSALQELLKSKGLDPEAVQLVLQDMMSGYERTFNEKADEDENENEDEDETGVDDVLDLDKEGENGGGK